MKKITFTLMALLLTCCVWVSTAQTVTGSNLTSVAIPDNNPTGIPSNVAIAGIPAGATITNVSVDLAINHTWAGDLIITLTAPTGNSIGLVNKPGTDTGAGDSSDLLTTSPITFNDTSMDNPETMGNTILGGAVICRDDARCAYFPNTSLVGNPPSANFANFAAAITASGLNPNGNWIVRISDTGFGDTGNFFVPQLRVTYAVAGADDPIINCPGDQMVNASPGACEAPFGFATPTALDPNGGTVTVTQTMGAPSPGPYPVGVTIIEFTATNDDAPNETTTCQFTITVVDNEAPTITCPADISQSNDVGVCGANVTVPAPTIMDNCPVVANNPPPVANSPTTNFLGTGQLANTPTVIAGTQMSIGGDVTLTATFTGDFSFPGESFDLQGPDGSLVLSDSSNTADCPAAPNQAVVTIPEATWNGWVTTFGPDLTFTLLADPQVNPTLCAGGNNYSLSAEQGMATGSTLSNDYNGTNDASDFYPVGTTVVTWTYTDAAGNSADCTMNVTVTDDEAPQIQCIGEPGVFNILEEFEGATTPAGWSTNVVSGNFDWEFGSGDMPIGADFPTNAAIFNDDAAGSGELDNTVELLSPVYDLTGADMATVGFDYAVQDFIGAGLFTVEVFDGAAWQSILVVDDTDQAPTTFAPVDVLAFANANFQVRFTFDDENDWGWGAGVDNFILSYNLATSPPFNVILDANGMATVNVADLLVSATDNCGAVTATTDVTGIAASSITTVFDSNNGLGGGSAVYFDVTVGANDIEITDLDLNTGDPGAFTVEMYTLVGTYVGNTANPAPWTLSATGAGTASGTVNVPSNAVLDASVTLTAGTTYGVALVMDATHGHSYSGTGTNPAPGMLMYSNADVTLNLGASSAAPFAGTAFSPRIWNGRINYLVESTTPVPVESFMVDCEDVGEMTVEVTVTDTAGNTSMCTATINVIDNIDPILVCKDFTLELGADGTAMLDPMDLIDMDLTFEACGLSVDAVSMDDFDCDDIGTPQTVTLFVSDPSGNLASCTATVTVVDLLAPVVTCPADMTIDPGAGTQLYEVPDYFADGLATALDNCTDPVTLFTQDPVAGSFLGDGVYTVTLSATDEYGNIGTCTFELTIESVLGVDDNSLETGITLYPNPAQNQVVLSNASNILLNKATMYDVNGKLVNTVDLTNMSTEKTIDISKLASGVYIVQIESENASVVKRLIKE